MEELHDLEDDYHVPGKPQFVQKVIIGQTQRYNLPIFAARIGNITNKLDRASPALFYIATQHAQEWLAAETAMQIIRYFAGEIKRRPNGSIAKLLSDRTLVVVPVANPDGYSYTHGVYANPNDSDPRSWRKNLRNNSPECPHDDGVDLNRNYLFGWSQQSSSPYCSSDEYRGPAPFSESEAVALKNLVMGNLEPEFGPDGSYDAVVALDVHTYGNMVLFSPGLGVAAHENKFCTTESNCQNPDFGLLRRLFGSEDPVSSYSWFQDPKWRYGDIDDKNTWPVEYDNDHIRWPVGTGPRVVYPVGGSLKDELMMGTGKQKPIAVTLELSWWKTDRFRPEVWSDDVYWKSIIQNQIKMLENHLLRRLSGLASGNYANTNVGKYTLPQIERRCYNQSSFHTEQCWGENTPAFYVAARNGLTNINIIPPSGFNGTTKQDLVGHTYTLFQWTNNDMPHVFPHEMEICSREAGCETMVFDSYDKELNLCSENLFPDKAGAYLESEPNCRWVLQVADGNYIERRKANLGKMRATRLFYSYKEPYCLTSYSIKTIIRSPDKQRIVRTHLRPGYGVYPSLSTYFRTMVVDAMDFDGLDDVSVRFEVEGYCNRDFLVGDVVFVGWRN